MTLIAISRTFTLIMCTLCFISAALVITTDDVDADPIQNQITIDSVSYDLSTNVITFTGTSSFDRIFVFVSGHEAVRVTVYVDSNGTFSGLLNVGSLENGEYLLTAFDSTSGVQTSKEFSVLPPQPAELIIDESRTLEVGHKLYVNYLIVSVSPESLTSQILWTSSNHEVVAVEGNFLEGKSQGTAVITATLNYNGEEYYDECIITINSPSEPETGLEYEFLIKAKMDADVACIGTQYLASDLRSGLVLTARGDNAADALNKACNSNGIPVELGMRKGTEGWVVHLFNVGDEQQPDGTWKYWVQYHDGKYNDWTLGHYTEGGYFELIYTITAEVPLAKTGLHYTGNDIEGVPGGPGYTVVGGIAKDVGTYTATATLTDAEYMWTDGTVEPKIIVWQILDNGSIPDNPDVPEVPSEHLDPDDQGVVVEHDSKTNDDGTVTEITTVTKTDESGNEVTTTISTTTYGDGTVEEIRSTPNTEVSDGVKTESILETVTIKDGNGSIVSETNITVSIVDNTASNAESKGISIYASDENANVTVSANAIEGSTSAIVVTDIKAAESNGQLEISDEALELALKMQGLYSKKIIEYSESVDTSEKVIQVKTDSSEAQVSLDSEAMKKVSDSNAAFRMSTSKGSITVEKDTLSGLSQRKEVTLSFSPADRSSMTSAQREVIEAGSTVVSLTATSAGQSIGSDLGGKVIVTVKHAAVDGKTPVAYYVDGDGNRTGVAEQHYDAEKEEMTMVLDHFSIYTIVDESPAGEELPVAVLVMTAVIFLICLGILLPQVVGRKQ